MMFYCPACKKLELENNSCTKNNRLKIFTNTRGGFGRAIVHCKCECGNLLAGEVATYGWNMDENTIDYVKCIISDYNEGGLLFTEEFDTHIKAIYKVLAQTKSQFYKEGSMSNSEFNGCMVWNVDDAFKSVKDYISLLEEKIEQLQRENDALRECLE